MPRVSLTQSLRRFKDDDPEVVAIDTETTGVEFFDEAFCATLAWRDRRGALLSGYCELPRYRDNLHDCLEGRRWVFHNAKFDLQKLILAGVLRRELLFPEAIEDTEALAHLLDENRKKGLKPLAESILGEDISDTQELRRVKKFFKITKNDGYERMPSLTLVPYAIKDAEFTLRLWEELSPLVVDAGLEDFYRGEMELCLVLLDVESSGMAINRDYIRKKIKEFNDRVVSLDFEIEDLVGKPVREGKIPAKVRHEFFNPNYPGDVLAELKKRGIKVTNTKKETLEPLNDELANIIEERRFKKKMVSSYLQPIIENEKGGVYHGNFRQHGTRTGRLSSGAAVD